MYNFEILAKVNTIIYYNLRIINIIVLYLYTFIEKHFVQTVFWNLV